MSDFDFSHHSTLDLMIERELQTHNAWVELQNETDKNTELSLVIRKLRESSVSE